MIYTYKQCKGYPQNSQIRHEPLLLLLLLLLRLLFHRHRHRHRHHLANHAQCLAGLFQSSAAGAIPSRQPSLCGEGRRKLKRCLASSAPNRPQAPSRSVGLLQRHLLNIAVLSGLAFFLPLLDPAHAASGLRFFPTRTRETRDRKPYSVRRRCQFWPTVRLSSIPRIHPAPPQISTSATTLPRPSSLPQSPPSSSPLLLLRPRSRPSISSTPSRSSIAPRRQRASRSASPAPAANGTMGRA